ncbi:MAG: PAC2 family protein [archaeon]
MEAPMIEIRPFKKIDLAGGVVIEGFPSVGLVTTIAATYLISTLKLDQIAAMDSTWFPPLSMIYAEKPKFPARIYASAEHKIAVCLSEFTPSTYLDRFIAKAILSWAREQKCGLAISPCGVPMLEDRSLQQPEQPLIHGVGSTEAARRKLKDTGVHLLEFGIVPGISGALLNEGRWDNYDVIALLVEAYHEVPDARAAAAIVQAIDKLLPQIELDVSPLHNEAEKIENRLRTLREQAKPVEKPPPTPLYG